MLLPSVCALWFLLLIRIAASFDLPTSPHIHVLAAPATLVASARQVSRMSCQVLHSQLRQNQCPFDEKIAPVAPRYREHLDPEVAQYRKIATLHPIPPSLPAATSHPPSLPIPSTPTHQHTTATSFPTPIFVHPASEIQPPQPTHSHHQPDGMATGCARTFSCHASVSKISSSLFVARCLHFEARLTARSSLANACTSCTHVDTSALRENFK